MAGSRVLPGSAPQAGYPLGGASGGSGTWASWVTEHRPGSPFRGYLRPALPAWRGPGSRGNRLSLLPFWSRRHRPGLRPREERGRWVSLLECLSSSWAEPRSDAVLSGTERLPPRPATPARASQARSAPLAPTPLPSWVWWDWPLGQFAGDSALTRW